MKKIIKFLVIFTMVFSIVSPFQDLLAQSFSVSANKSASPGEKVYVGVNFNGEGRFNISVSNGAGGSTFWYPDSKGATITVGSSGTTTVTVTAVNAVTTDEIEINGQTVSIQIQIKAPSTGGGSSGGNSGGSNNGGGSVPGNSGTYNPNLPIAETPAEKAARLEQEEADRLKKEQSTPLIESIEIVSNSDKRKDKVLETLLPEFELFDFEYVLPTFIDNVKFNVKPVGDDVTVLVEPEYSISESSTIVIKATKGEITQEYKITVSPNADALIKTDKGIVYQDDLLNQKFVDLGFELKEIEIAGNASTMFTKGLLNLHMIMNDERKVEFHRLDENGVSLDEGQIILDDSSVYFVGTELPEEIKTYKLYNEGVKNIPLQIPEFLAEVDESLSIASNTEGWEYEEGSVFYALNEELSTNYIRTTSENKVDIIVVAFDKIGKMDSIVLYGVMILITLLLTITTWFIVYYIRTKKRFKMMSHR